MIDEHDWELRVAGLWDAFDELPEEEFLARTEALAGDRRRQAVIQMIVLTALARHLPRYQRSVTNYAREL